MLGEDPFYGVLFILYTKNLNEKARLNELGAEFQK